MGAAPVMSLALRAAWYATLLVGTAAAHPIFYVGPHGSDAAGCPGTQERPFGTLQRALAAFRDSSSGGNASSRGGELLLLNGTYRLEQGVTISAADTAGLSVDGQELLRIASLHPGGAVLSGGVEIVGGSWSPARGVVDGWQALLPLSLRSFGSTASARFRQAFCRWCASQADNVQLDVAAASRHGLRPSAQRLGTEATWIRLSY